MNPVNQNRGCPSKRPTLQSTDLRRSSATPHPPAQCHREGTTAASWVPGTWQRCPSPPARRALPGKMTALQLLKATRQTMLCIARLRASLQLRDMEQIRHLRCWHSRQVHLSHFTCQFCSSATLGTMRNPSSESEWVAPAGLATSCEWMLQSTNPALSNS